MRTGTAPLIKEFAELVCRNGHKGQWVMRKGTKTSKICVSCRNEAAKRYRESIRSGIPTERTNRGVKSIFNEEQKADICARYLSGETQSKIARSLGTSPMTIYRILLVAEIESRRSGWTHENKKTHCYNGHELSGDNLLKNVRACRICHNLKQKDYYKNVRKARLEKAKAKK